MIELSKKQARRFMLLKQGLLDDYLFCGKQGVLDFITQAGCIQFDPIDVCGKNAELVLQSRVKDFTKTMLSELLYKERKLIDFFDKNLSILHISDWAYFTRFRDAQRDGGKNKEHIDTVCEQIKQMIHERGALCSADIGLTEKVSWYWSDTKLSRAVLEALYFRGDLIIHHKKGSFKYYDLAERHIPSELLHCADPFLDEADHMQWRVLRRIGAVGLLWNKPSDAWLNIQNLRSAERKEAFSTLLDRTCIVAVHIEGIKDTLYMRSEDTKFLQYVLTNDTATGRCELLAPLDNMLWDRKLIKVLWDFEYKWEIYTPKEQRTYGHYVLPLLYSDMFIGRVEAVCDKKAHSMIIQNVWLENGVIPTDELHDSLDNCFKRFAAFNECTEIIRNDNLR